MDKEAIQLQIKDVMTNYFSVESSEIGSDFSIQTVENWDSMKHIGMIMALEQEFGIQVEIEDAAEMINFSSVCDYIYRYIENK